MEIKTKRKLVRLRNSAFRRYIRKHEKHLPVLFFMGGFIFDTMTLGRIDRIYDLSILCLHMIFLTVNIYLLNLADDQKWKNTFIERFEIYLPLAIQFSFGALSSAYVIYFSRSVSLSKTASFFIILVFILFANELLKKRISNKYLQFSVLYFLSFTFFSFIIPVFIRKMNQDIFLISGFTSLAYIFSLLIFIYLVSPSTRKEVHLGKMISMILILYTTLNFFYFFKLIPPVPLALEEGIVAHQVEISNDKYKVIYEADEWYIFWRDHRLEFTHRPNEDVYIFTSIFAPTNLEKAIAHRWKWLNPTTKNWEIVEDIAYEIKGGRTGGYRGYTYKNNVKNGIWKVEVITVDEELVLGVVDFEIVSGSSTKQIDLKERTF
ncbi:DUF2914 domain-containing protein [Albibacterium sp.]|uniref:DUF2914 domain-containing protein n=1 Tax=Albibacterium sp. TaxID=2952885 RepID=UPI002B56779A|nr:DUF2914 domain-containing protein [Albibacterium sp.]HUH18775.1 DUF2914 domain-containing protein [Albibacterium sp.]